MSNQLTLKFIATLELSKDVLVKIVLSTHAILKGSKLKINVPQDSQPLGLQFSFAEDKIEPSIEIDLRHQQKVTLYCVGVTS